MASFSIPTFKTSSGPAVASSSGGGGAYGTVPGPIAVPPSQFAQASAAVPGLPKLTDTASSVIGDELGGKLSTGTINLLQDKAAQFGVNSGMPLSGLSIENLMENIGLTSELLSQKGTKDYLSFLSSTGSLQNNPALIAEISNRNSNNAAAPDPRAAAMEQLRLLEEFYTRFGGGSARPSSGSGVPGGTYTLPSNPGGKISPAFLPGPDSYGTNLMATASGVFPAGTPSAVTNPGADYSSGISGYYYDPNNPIVGDPEYAPMIE